MATCFGNVGVTGRKWKVAMVWDILQLEWSSNPSGHDAICLTNLRATFNNHQFNNESLIYQYIPNRTHQTPRATHGENISFSCTMNTDDYKMIKTNTFNSKV